jgi:digeranylgeranylglycerophospholipid reductase
MSRIYNYDVVVVGCGPAGSMAGMAAARGGAKTLIIEKRKDIGIPVRCAESVAGLHLYEERLGIKVDPASISNDKVDSMVLYSPSGRASGVHQIRASIVERRLFDKELARHAVRAGAELLINTRALDVLREGEAVHGVKAKSDGEEVEIQAKVVIGADGFASNIARWSGLKRPQLSFQCYSFEFMGLKQDPNTIPIFIGTQFCPGAHVWWMPKGPDTANVGIGVLNGFLGRNVSLRRLFANFMAHPIASKMLEGATPTARLTGTTWYGAPAERTCGHGVLLAGDAGAIVWVAHGAGIAMSMSSGYLAGQAAAQAVEEGDVSPRSLARYEAKWKSTIGKSVLPQVEAAKVFRELVADDEMMDRAVEDIGTEVLAMLIHGRGYIEPVKDWLREYRKKQG